LPSLRQVTATYGRDMHTNSPHPRNLQSGLVRAGDILNAHGAQMEALIRLGIDKKIWTMDEVLEKIDNVIDEQSGDDGLN
jgi:hypothetical protein